MALIDFAEKIKTMAAKVSNARQSIQTELDNKGYGSKPTLNTANPELPNYIGNIEHYDTNGRLKPFVESVIKTPPVCYQSDYYETYKLSDNGTKKGVEKTRVNTFPSSSSLRNTYPRVELEGSKSDTGRVQYDYTIDLEVQKDIQAAIADIKKNLNVPSAYNRLELNRLFHRNFNRFRVQYQDYFMSGTSAFVVFTRPDLNLYNQEGGENGLWKLNADIESDPVMMAAIAANPETPRLLTQAYTGNHHFNPLLSNVIMSLDVADESIDTLETGETFSGYKTQYAKSNIRSMTAGTISINFPEIYNLAITHLHQIWCKYESDVYRGVLKPKDKYIWGRELDYACDIYYFLLDKQDMIIRYWCKFTGCFPLNVNKSVFSFSGENPVQTPTLGVTYAYFSREDMNLINLNEFNLNAGGINSNFRYKANYIPQLGHSGTTWTDRPFIQKIKVKTGFEDGTLYVLRFKPIESDGILTAQNAVNGVINTGISKVGSIINTGINIFNNFF